jgi:transposase-like protein
MPIIPRSAVQDVSMSARWLRAQEKAACERAEDRLDAAASVASAPARCPGCRSLEVMTTSKVITVDAYWRCRSCGDVWNVRRRREAARHERVNHFLR